MMPSSCFLPRMRPYTCARSFQSMFFWWRVSFWWFSNWTNVDVSFHYQLLSMANLGFSSHVTSGDFLPGSFSGKCIRIFLFSTHSFQKFFCWSVGWQQVIFFFLSPSQCDLLPSFSQCGLRYLDFNSVSLIYLLVSNPTSNSCCLWLCWLIRSALFHSGFYQLESLLTFCAWWTALHSLFGLHFWRNRSCLLNLQYSSSL